jgi:hypothetical protein
MNWPKFKCQKLIKLIVIKSKISRQLIFQYLLLYVIKSQFKNLFILIFTNFLRGEVIPCLTEKYRQIVLDFIMTY